MNRRNAIVSICVVALGLAVMAADASAQGSLRGRITIDGSSTVYPVP